MSSAGLHWRCCCCRFILYVAFLVSPGLTAELSLWNVPFNSSRYQVFRKTLYANTTIYMNFYGDHTTCDANLAFNISWYLRSSVCYNEVFNTPDKAAINMFGMENMLRRTGTSPYHQDFSSYQPLSSPKSDPSTNQTLSWLDKPNLGAVAKAWEDGPYLFMVKVQTFQRPIDEFDDGTFASQCKWR
ncbi:hypothetical protein CRUP_029388 [Coryphaenoides rupestris]|nr:hypothetical protein CRUP_029388 [Coryphaenoides rupestris]